MAKLTPKENYMRLTTGECPEWVPIYSFFPDPNIDEAPATIMVGPNILGSFRGPEGGKDPWGVTYVTSESTNNAALPKPNDFILEDITKWRDVIKTPDFSYVDWETMAKKDYGMFPIDRNQTAVIYPSQGGMFQDLMSFMGFSEGLCAFYEEPEEVKALFDYMSDFYVEMNTKALDYYKPDLFYILDDSATALNPFISPEMFREFLKPYYMKISKPARERGIPITMHNCGRCEDLIDDWFDIGVNIWDPAQTMNDLAGIKAKHGNKLAIAGGWDFKVPATWPEVNEEEIRASVRESIDRFAPEGGYAFCGAALGAKGDQAIMQINSWVMDEAYHYGKTFYNRK